MITVYVREKGQLVDLTGYAVKYEAMNQIGQFVRDDAEIVDAKNGVFSYTLSSQAVSTSDDWTAYFVMEKYRTNEYTRHSYYIKARCERRKY